MLIEFGRKDTTFLPNNGVVTMIFSKKYFFLLNITAFAYKY